LWTTDVLTDPAKFDLTAPVSFSALDQGAIITTTLASNTYKNIQKNGRWMKRDFYCDF